MGLLAARVEILLIDLTENRKLAERIGEGTVVEV